MARRKTTSKGTPLSLLEDALERYKLRGSRKVNFIGLVDCLKSSSVAQYINFDVLKTKSTYRWRTRSGHIEEWGHLQIMCVMNFERSGHNIRYNTIPQLIAALEEVLPILEKELQEIYKM